MTSFIEAITEDGSTAYGVEEIIHGKEIREGSVLSGSIELSANRPVRTLSFRMVPGKSQRFTVKFRASIQGTPVGNAVAVGTRTFLGFESTSTPLGTFDNAAHIRSSLTLTVKIRANGSVVSTVSTTDAWTVVGLGTVFFTRGTQTFQDGALIQTHGPFNYTFDHGLYRGVAQP